MYLYFTRPLEELGHEVRTFDHHERSRRLGRVATTQELLREIETGNDDIVFYQTASTEPVETSALAELSRRRLIVAWNSDDDWQWAYTGPRAAHFTFMVTTYPSIHRANRLRVPNLLLSQWACLESREPRLAKDIDFSFAGAVYKTRNADCRRLRRSAGLRCFGRGARLVNLGIPYFKGAFRLPLLSGEAIDFSEINAVWERSRVSYTPLGGGPTGEVLSLKSRLFDMGFARTLMLCELAPDLEAYYEPEKEFVSYRTLEECAEKAAYYLRNESARAAIADRYRRRTLADHLWTRRFRDLFAQMRI